MCFSTQVFSNIIDRNTINNRLTLVAWSALFEIYRQLIYVHKRKNVQNVFLIIRVLKFSLLVSIVSFKLSHIVSREFDNIRNKIQFTPSAPQGSENSSRGALLHKLVRCRLKPLKTLSILYCLPEPDGSNRAPALNSHTLLLESLKFGGICHVR